VFSNADPAELHLLTNTELIKFHPEGVGQ
jgi:hypothetical protein